MNHTMHTHHHSYYPPSLHIQPLAFETRNTSCLVNVMSFIFYLNINVITLTLPNKNTNTPSICLESYHSFICRRFFNYCTDNNWRIKQGAITNYNLDNDRACTLDCPTSPPPFWGPLPMTCDDQDLYTNVALYSGSDHYLYTIHRLDG